jgi:hypothetical protein
MTNEHEHLQFDIIQHPYVHQIFTNLLVSASNPVCLFKILLHAMGTNSFLFTNPSRLAISPTSFQKTLAALS